MDQINCKCNVTLELLAESKSRSYFEKDLSYKTVFHKCPECSTVHKTRVITTQIHGQERDIIFKTEDYKGILTEDQIREYIPKLEGLVYNCDEHRIIRKK